MSTKALDLESSEIVTSTITVSIPEFFEKYIDSNKKTITFYKINIFNHYSKTEWTLDKRFSEFEAIHKELTQLLLNIPEMSKKTLFKVSSYESLTKRRLELEQFVKECVLRKDILSSEPFKSFLELEKNSPEIVSNAPTIVGELTNLPLGIRDFYYSHEEGVVFTCCSDMNIVSRADSWLTNIKFPWEKKDEIYVPVGSAFCHKVQKKEDGYEFTKAWGVAFPIQTGILNWDNDSFILSIGLDNGKIYCYKHEKDSNFIKFEELCQIKPHKDRVMGIAFDFHSGYIYSCSTDKSFLISDINYSSTPVEVCKNLFGYTNLQYDKRNSRLFLTDEGGNLDVFLNTTHPPTQITRITSTNQGCIRGFHIDHKKNLMFTCSTSGAITIFDLCLPGKEKNAVEISNFGWKTKWRVIRYDPELHELISGDENGRITIWSWKTGRQYVSSFNNLKKIDTWSAHPSKAITQLFFEADKRLLWSGGKDCSLKIWQLPEKWSNEEIEKFEKNELKQKSDELAKKKIQKTLQKKKENDSSDSSDDDWNGWNYRDL